MIYNDKVTISNAQGTHTGSLRDYPNVWVMIMTLNAVLTNHAAFLQNNYRINISGNATAWILTLRPKSTTSQHVLQIKLTGSKSKINAMLTQYNNGDLIMQTFTQSGHKK
jgi:hypothetical protein